MEKKWWHGKTAYQIYPKSFYDSNGDGIGDIPGIIEKLDYLKKLGADILWLSPVYVSPMADQGYDIADYYGIAPRFGTMEDMDRLLAEAKKRDMYILMDLVVNHCSDEHQWFQKACQDPDGPYGGYFYLEKAGEDWEDNLPCNWRSYFGGPVWERLPGTDRIYLHVFHKKQPDLNWENPRLREEVYKMVNWWLDKGLAGFRIDAIINIKKPLPFSNYPADREDGLCSMDRVMKEANGIGQFLGELRDRAFAPHNAFTVGEVFNEKDDELKDFIGDNGYFSSMFDFRANLKGRNEDGWYASWLPSPDDYKRCCFESQRRAEGVGFLSNIIENHDEPRGVSRYLPKEAQNETGKKLLATMYFFLKGLPFIYQGQELGMENVKFQSIHEVDDINTLDEYQVARKAGLSEKEALEAVNQYSRDNARTPFQWTGEENAGFTAGTPWLRVNPNYVQINAEEQMKRPESVWNYYRKLSKLRKDPEYMDTLVYGKTEPALEDLPGIMAYFRRGKGQDILVAGNFTGEPRIIELPELKKGRARLLLDNCLLWEEEGKDAALPCPAIRDGKLELKPFQAQVIALG